MTGHSYWLLDTGTEIAPGDEFYDSDFHAWEPMNLKLVGRKASDKDIIRRLSYDLTGLLQQLVTHLSVAESFRDNRWQIKLDSLVNEGRRRLGVKTMDDYTKSEIIT